MEVCLEKKGLFKALSHHQSLVERRGSIPILSHLLLETHGSTSLSLTGTDLEISLMETVPASVRSPGKAALPAHIFHDIVRKLPDHSPIIIKLIVPGNQALVSSGPIEFTLPTLPVDDFPKVHPEALPFKINLPATLLKQLIEDTRFAMSSEEARYSLNGIYFHPHEDQWRAVATDARRLAFSWIPLTSGLLEGMPNVIIGRKAVQEIVKLLDEYTEEVSLSLSLQQLTLEFPGGIFSSRLLEGQFPEYWQAIPLNHPFSMEFNVEAISQAVSRVGMVSSEKQRLIKFTFCPQELTLSANSTQYGSALETLGISYEGDEFAVGFNPKHFLDICQHVKGPTVRLILKDGTSPVLFQDPSDEKVSYVLMPMRI